MSRGLLIGSRIQYASTIQNTPKLGCLDRIYLGNRHSGLDRGSRQPKSFRVVAGAALALEECDLDCVAMKSAEGYIHCKLGLRVSITP
jgi:hypothetical protein